tara:strand:+ start:6897 stop:7505 length:609 start_codon:yes stop_codon:yes gene_type:complete
MSNSTLKRSTRKPIARRSSASRNPVHVEQRVGDIDDYEVTSSLDQIWEVLGNLQNRMVQPAKRRVVREARNPQMGRLTSETGTMRIKETGDGFGTNAIEIMGADNWKTFSAKMPEELRSYEVPSTWKSDPPSEGLETGELTAGQLTHFNAQFDRIASLENQLEQMTNNLNLLLRNLSNKELFNLKDIEKEVDMDINVGKTIG